MAAERFNDKNLPIQSICKKLNEQQINIEPEWQRNVVWTPDKKELLVQSVIDGFPINPIVLWQTDCGELICVDGKNRLVAINEYVNKGSFKVSGKYFKDLSPHMQSAINDYNLCIRYLTGKYWTEENVRDYFQRIQEGAKLTWNERINALPNNHFVDFLRTIMDSKKDAFRKLLGENCNARHELYTTIANILSVHPILVETYRNMSEKNRGKTADSGKSFKAYVECMAAAKFTDDQRTVLNKHVSMTLDLVRHLSNTFSKVWNPHAKYSAKPSTKDFTTVSYFVCNSRGKYSYDQMKDKLVHVFKHFLNNLSNHASQVYYAGEGQSEYSMKSLERRYAALEATLRSTVRA